jgi:hypothetical protein
LVVNDGGANLDFRVEGDTDANTLFVDAGTNKVGIGTNSPGAPLSFANAIGLKIDILNAGAGSENGFGIESNEFRICAGSTAAMTFFTGGYSGTERARITSNGEFLVGATSASATSKGVQLFSSGEALIIRDNATPMLINRLTSDGDLIEFRQASATEGSISVSGNTVSYNAFTGGHWTQLQEGRGYNPEIPRGTVMSSIGEMAVWKSVTWAETIEHPSTEEKEAWTESIQHRESYLGNLDIGETFEEDGFTKTVVDDGNERLPKVKISDVVGDKAVYGVFQTWDDVEDMLITSLGAFVVRIAAGVTVQIGDLLESNGDGCAKVQDDDIIRSKTIGKVTSTVATATYDDGSYCVPCVIYCG